MRKKNHENKPSTSEPPKPTEKRIDWYTARLDGPIYSEPWTIVIGGLSGQSRDNPLAPKTERNTEDSDQTRRTPRAKREHRYLSDIPALPM